MWNAPSAYDCIQRPQPFSCPHSRARYSGADFRQKPVGCGSGPEEEVRLAREQRWIASAYDRSGERLFRYALMITGRRELAEDAVQQAFLKLLARGEPGEVHSEAAFLRTVVRNEAYRLMSRRRVEMALPEEDLLAAAGEAPADEEERQRLQQAIRQLTPEQRELVHLKVYEQLTFAEIGEVLGIPLNTAASRYRYAVENLRAMLVEKSHER